MGPAQAHDFHLSICPSVSRLADDAFTLPVRVGLHGNIPSDGAASGALSFRITRLAETIVTINLPLSSEILEELAASGEVSFETMLDLEPLVSSGSCGLGIHARVQLGGGIEGEARTSIDRGEGPVRYGFLSDFSPQDSDSRDAAVDFLLANHITHVQFYDWSFRPHQYRPQVGHDVSESDVYQDTMGKTIDLKVVRDLIGELHDRRMRALGYGAVYAAGAEYVHNHPEQALYDHEGHTIDLIGKFFIMDCAEGKPWRACILDQYRYAVAEVGFDGIHMDTYGFPKTAWDSDGQLVELPPQFVSLIDEWAAHGDVNIFNNVGGWPADATGRAHQEAVYIEVWPPHTRYRHMRQLIKDTRRSGKPVVMAAYLELFKLRQVDLKIGTTGALHAYRLLTAAICACGATHLILGEQGAVLTQPYYSDYTRLTDAERRVVQAYSDFQVRYRELLYDPASIEITESHVLGENREFSVEVDGLGTPGVSFDGEPGTVWTAVHRQEQRIVINLINLTEQDDSNWNTAKKDSTTAAVVRIQIPRYTDTMRIFVASPDKDHGDALQLDSTLVTGPRTSALEVIVEDLAWWSVIWVELT